MIGQPVAVKRVGEHEWVVTPAGERDLADKAALEDAIAGVFAKGSIVVLDLSETTFIDSAVVSVVAASARRAQDGGHRFVVSAPPGGQPRRVLDLVEAAAFVDVVGGFVEVVDDPGQALYY